VYVSPNLSVLSCGFTITDPVSGKSVNVAYSTTGTPSTSQALAGNWIATYLDSSGNFQSATGTLPTISLQNLADGNDNISIAISALGNVFVSNNTCPTSFSILASGASVYLTPNRSVLSCGFSITDPVSAKSVSVAYSTT
jgi:hypothetical protein